MDCIEKELYLLSVLFQGRMLHVLPGKEKKTEEESFKEGSSFKNKKASKTKAQSGRYAYYIKNYVCSS